MALWSLVFAGVCLALSSSVAGQTKETQAALKQIYDNRMFATTLIFNRDVHKIIYSNELIQQTKVGLKGRFETIEGIYCYVTGDRSSPRSVLYFYDLTFFSFNNLRNADSLASEGNLLVVMPDVVDYKKMFDGATQFLSPANLIQGRNFLTNVFEKIKEKFCQTKFFQKMCDSTETPEASVSASASLPAAPAPPQASYPQDLPTFPVPPNLQNKFFPIPAVLPPRPVPAKVQTNLGTLEGSRSAQPKSPAAPSASRRKRRGFLNELQVMPPMPQTFEAQYKPGIFAPFPYPVVPLPPGANLSFVFPKPIHVEPVQTNLGTLNSDACGPLEAIEEKQVENLKALLDKLIPTLPSKRPGVIGNDIGANTAARIIARHPTMFQAAVLVSPSDMDRPFGACGVQVPLQVYFAGSENNYKKIHAVLKSTFTDNHHHHVYAKASLDFFGSQFTAMGEAVNKDDQEAAASVIAEAAKFFNRMIQV